MFISQLFDILTTLACLSLQLLPIICVPFTSLYLLKFEDYTFGVYGLCHTPSSTCSSASIGYPFQESKYEVSISYDSEMSTFLPGEVTHTILKLLIVHVVSFVSTCIILLFEITFLLIECLRKNQCKSLNSVLNRLKLLRIGRKDIESSVPLQTLNERERPVSVDSPKLQVNDGLNSTSGDFSNRAGNLSNFTLDTNAGSSHVLPINTMARRGEITILQSNNHENDSISPLNLEINEGANQTSRAPTNSSLQRRQMEDSFFLDDEDSNGHSKHKFCLINPSLDLVLNTYLCVTLIDFLSILLGFLSDVLLFVDFLTWIGWIQLLPLVIFAFKSTFVCFKKRSISTKKYLQDSRNYENDEMRTRKNTIVNRWNDSDSDDGFYVYTNGFAMTGETPDTELLRGTGETRSIVE